MITVTDTAKAHLQELIGDHYAIKIGVQTKGCNGMVYSMTYASDKGALDEEVLLDSVRLLIDPQAIMFIIGTEIDYQTNELQSGFVFTNPNEKGRCGCGKSFHV